MLAIFERKIQTDSIVVVSRGISSNNPSCANILAETMEDFEDLMTEFVNTPHPPSLPKSLPKSLGKWRP